MSWLDFYYRSRYDAKIMGFWSWLKAGYGLDNVYDLSRSWWTLTITARKDIGTRIIKVYCASLPGKLQVRANSKDPWSAVYCLGRAVLQTTMIGNLELQHALWFAQWNCWGQARSYYPINPLTINLPANCANVTCVTKNWYHEVSALQIDKDITKLGSWMFFSGSSGVIPSDGSNSQIPHGSIISIHSNDPLIANYTIGSIGAVKPGGTTVIVTFTIP